MQAKTIAKVPVYAMIRSREGDFIFQDHEKESMLADIANVKKIGLNGVVIGALTADGKIDLDFVRAMGKKLVHWESPFIAPLITAQIPMKH